MIEEILGRSPVVPVVTLEDTADAAEIARALLRGGIRTLELTLRTSAAMQAIGTVAREVPEIAVGAGTIRTPADLHAAADAGASFGVSAGSTPALLEAGRKSIPYMPGIATASELMGALAHGYRAVKFFPASAAGGIEAIRALAAPFPETRFCPTGGITLATARDYLALPAVLCVGGSWLTPTDALRARDWKRIESLAREASRLRSAW